MTNEEKRETLTALAELTSSEQQFVLGYMAGRMTDRPRDTPGEADPAAADLSEESRARAGQSPEAPG